MPSELSPSRRKAQGVVRANASVFEWIQILLYANDHLPAHVHVLKGERWAKIELITLTVNYSTFKNQELKQCLGIIKSNQSEFWRCGMPGFKGKSVHVDDRHLHVELQDGRVISTPIHWYAELESLNL